MSFASRLTSLTNSLAGFTALGSSLTLRPYQLEVAQAVVESALRALGLTFVVVFPRQSGKNETQSVIQAYLLTLLSHHPVEIVSISPTFKPQTLNALDRLERRLQENPFTRGRWHRHAGFTIRLGQASIHFLSGSPRAHTVGATASLLLNIDEAQDILKSAYDRKFAPMAASTHATRVFWGTAWTSSTLLAREVRAARRLQEQDGIRRLWLLTAAEVESVHPPYGGFVRAEVARLGRDHPFIRTQYFSEEIDSQLSMFHPARLALIRSDAAPLADADSLADAASLADATSSCDQPRWRYESPACDQPCRRRREASPPGEESPAQADQANAFLLDVAGQDESRMEIGADEEAPLNNPGRDAVSLSIASIDLSTLPVLRAPTYRIVHRRQWLGLNHLTVFGQLKSLVESWNPQYIVMDATGVGEGLWALLDRAFPARLIPVKFSAREKSEIGWRFLSIIETGRFRDCAPSDAVRLQYTHCRSTVLPGPARLLRWGVPDGARGPDGELIHDDYLLADSLVARLDTLAWVLPMHAALVTPDPRRPHEDDGFYPASPLTGLEF